MSNPTHEPNPATRAEVAAIVGNLDKEDRRRRLGYAIEEAKSHLDELSEVSEVSAEWNDAHRRAVGHLSELEAELADLEAPTCVFCDGAGCPLCDPGKAVHSCCK